MCPADLATESAISRTGISIQYHLQTTNQPAWLTVVGLQPREVWADLLLSTAQTTPARSGRRRASVPPSLTSSRSLLRSRRPLLRAMTDVLTFELFLDSPCAYSGSLQLGATLSMGRAAITNDRGPHNTADGARMAQPQEPTLCAARHRQP
jgi:hypothetical protein